MRQDEADRMHFDTTCTASLQIDRSPRLCVFVRGEV